jgi:DcaP outer membrane protein
MQKKLAQLEKDLTELRQQIDTVSGPSKQAVPGSSIPVTTDTRQAEEHAEQPKVSSSIDIYGYAMTDTGYNFGSINPNWFDVERPTQSPAFQGEFGPDGNAYFGVRLTRFGVESFTPTPLGDLETIFEFELFGTGADPGQTTFRLRHAYGELGHFGAGQTWSPFKDIDVFPNSLEYQPLRNALSGEASVSVRKDNYERLFDEARKKVRAWEAANPKGNNSTTSAEGPSSELP